jgi:hypothetical protein
MLSGAEVLYLLHRSHKGKINEKSLKQKIRREVVVVELPHIHPVPNYLRLPQVIRAHRNIKPRGENEDIMPLKLKSVKPYHSIHSFFALCSVQLQVESIILLTGDYKMK